MNKMHGISLTCPLVYFSFWCFYSLFHQQKRHRITLTFSFFVFPVFSFSHFSQLTKILWYRDFLHCFKFVGSLIGHWNMVFYIITWLGVSMMVTPEQHTLKNVNNCLNTNTTDLTNTYSYLEQSGEQSSNLYLNVVHFEHQF